MRPVEDLERVICGTYNGVVDRMLGVVFVITKGSIMAATYAGRFDIGAIPTRILKIHMHHKW